MNNNKTSSQAARRFWTSAQVARGSGATWSVQLDNRPIRTPAGAALTAPTQGLAERIAAEWNAVGEEIDPNAMPATRLAFTVIDRIGDARAATAAEVARFAGSDLLCYRAEGPESLVARQAELWDPWLARAEAELGLSFVRTAGIVHAAQPPATLEAVQSLAEGLDDFALAGVAAAAGLFGSAVLAIALQRGWLAAETAFALSQLDETWQAERWGEDAEAVARIAGLRRDALALGGWFEALGAG